MRPSSVHALHKNLVLSLFIWLIYSSPYTVWVPYCIPDLLGSSVFRSQHVCCLFSNDFLETLRSEFCLNLTWYLAEVSSNVSSCRLSLFNRSFMSSISAHRCLYSLRSASNSLLYSWRSASDVISGYVLVGRAASEIILCQSLKPYKHFHCSGTRISHYTVQLSLRWGLPLNHRNLVHNYLQWWSFRLQMCPSTIFTEVEADWNTVKCNYLFINYSDSMFCTFGPILSLCLSTNPCGVACLRGLTILLARVKHIDTVEPFPHFAV